MHSGPERVSGRSGAPHVPEPGRGSGRSLLPVRALGALHRHACAETTCGVITYVHNEKHTLPIWLRYYARHFARADMYVLDHNTEDGSTSAAAMAAFSGVNVIKLSGDARWMPHAFLNRAVEAHIKRMLDGGYKCALLAEVDDMIIADPNVYPGGLAELLKAFVASSAKYHRTLGYELSHVSEGEEPLEGR